MNRHITDTEAVSYLQKQANREVVFHTNRHIMFEHNRDDSICIPPAFKTMVIYLGLKDLHDDQRKYGYVTDKSFVKAYASMYHEIGHSITYTNMDKKQQKHVPMTNIEKDIRIDTAINNVIPEYHIITYYDSPDEKLAEHHSLNKIIEFSANKHSIFNKLGIDAENILLSDIKSRGIWYSQDKTVITSAHTLKDLSDLLMNEVNIGAYRPLGKMSNVREIKLTSYENDTESIIDKLYKKPELKLYIENAQTKLQLQQAILDSMYTIGYNDIMSICINNLSDKLQQPKKIIIASDREIKNKPNFQNNIEADSLLYDPP